MAIIRGKQENEEKYWPQCYIGSLEPHVVIARIEPEAFQYKASV